MSLIFSTGSLLESTVSDDGRDVLDFQYWLVLESTISDDG